MEGGRACGLAGCVVAGDCLRRTRSGLQRDNRARAVAAMQQCVYGFCGMRASCF